MLILMDGVNDMKKEWWFILRVLIGHMKIEVKKNGKLWSNMDGDGCKMTKKIIADYSW